MSDLAFGLYLAAAGMGVVFAVLAMLWGVLALMEKISARLATAPPAESDAQPRAMSEAAMAAIAIAVLTHREARRRQAAPETRTTVPGSQLYASRWVAAGRTRQTRGWQGRR